MPFSHHSHSGQFCPGHATDQLEEIVKTAISKKMLVFGLTEHMPRHDMDAYPEEIDSGWTMESGFQNQSDYFKEATRLREKYREQIEIPIGFESDFCRPESAALIQRTLSAHDFDFYMGSLHHVHSIPIDYDQPLYERARQISGGTDEQLFQDYFDEHLEMLRVLRPPVIGHLDVIRLKSDNPNASFRMMPGVWQRILRNLDFIASYGGLVEINCASFRKGMDEPYPRIEICQEFVQRGGRFCLSDDSHGIAGVAHSYSNVLPFLRKARIQSLHYLKHSVKTEKPYDSRFPHTEIHKLSLDSISMLDFWSAQL